MSFVTKRPGISVVRHLSGRMNGCTGGCRQSHRLGLLIAKPKFVSNSRRVNEAPRSDLLTRS